jgi:hypothetical protein
MPCFFGRAEAEKAELRELLELSNSQREEYRKAAEGASRRAEHVGKQLEARLAELQDLSSHYQVRGMDRCCCSAAVCMPRTSSRPA